MSVFSAISIFCEDIRSEVGGTETLVGILPDNISVGAIPGVFPRLCIYTRILIASDLNPGKIRIYIKNPGAADEQSLGDVPEELINTALVEARSAERKGVGLIHRVKMDNFPVHQEGKLFVFVNSGLGEQFSGALNIMSNLPETGK